MATNDRVTVAVGCGVWAVLLVLSLAFGDRLAADGRQWWLWTCVAGLGFGLAGLAFLQHQAVRRRSRPHPTARSTSAVAGSTAPSSTASST